MSLGGVLLLALIVAVVVIGMKVRRNSLKLQRKAKKTASRRKRYLEKFHLTTPSPLREELSFYFRKKQQKFIPMAGRF